MSEPLHIYGHMLSQFTRSVCSFCTLSSIPFSFQTIDVLNREQFSASFSKLSPHNSIPAISHGTYSLWESAAIVPYLADAFAVDNQWYPREPKLRGQINAFLHWHHQGCTEPVASYLRAKFIAPKYFGAPLLSPMAEAPLKAGFEGFFEVFGGIIRQTGYAARTSRPSIADVFVYSELATSMMIDWDMSAYQEVGRWYQEIGGIPEIHEAHEVLRNEVAGYKQ